MTLLQMTFLTHCSTLFKIDFAAIKLKNVYKQTACGKQKYYRVINKSNGAIAIKDFSLLWHHKKLAFIIAYMRCCLCQSREKFKIARKSILHFCNFISLWFDDQFTNSRFLLCEIFSVPLFTFGDKNLLSLIFLLTIFF